MGCGAILRNALVCGLLAVQANAASVDVEGLVPPGNVLTFPGIDNAEGLSAPQARQFESGQNAFLESDFARAEEIARQLVTSNPGAKQAWFLLGLALANLERYDEAIDALDKSAALYAKNAEPLVIKGSILLHLRRPEEARVAFRQAVERDPSNWRACETLGMLQMEDGALDEATLNFERAAAAAPPDRMETRLRLADAYARSDRLADAIGVLERYLATNPTQNRVRLALARLQTAAGDTDAAADSLAAAALREPERVDLTLGAAQAELAAGRLDAATDRLLSARDAMAMTPTALREAGTLLGVARAYDEAVVTFRMGLEAAPQDTALRRGLRTALLRQEKLDEARAVAEDLADDPGAEPADLLWLGIIEEQVGDTEAAAAAYRDTLENAPDSWIAANNLAMLLMDSDPTAAISLAEQAATASNDAAEVRQTLGLALLAAGEPTRAQAVFEQLASEFPDDADTSYRYGRALLEAGDTEAGRATLEKALRLDPGFADADAARTLLRAE